MSLKHQLVKWVQSTSWLNESNTPAWLNESNTSAWLNESKAPAWLNESKAPAWLNESNAPTWLNESNAPAVLWHFCDEDRDRNPWRWGVGGAVHITQYCWVYRTKGRLMLEGRFTPLCS